MTGAEFLILYPEFVSTDSTMLTAVIAEQELFVSDTWGAARTAALALSVAARLADSPQGRAARLAEPRRNVYSDRLEEMKLAHACANFRIG